MFLGCKLHRQGIRMTAVVECTSQDVSPFSAVAITKNTTPGDKHRSHTHRRFTMTLEDEQQFSILIPNEVADRVLKLRSRRDRSSRFALAHDQIPFIGFEAGASLRSPGNV